MLIITLVHAATPNHAYACFCAGPPLPEKLMQSEDVVFLGKVVSITDSPMPTSRQDPIPILTRTTLFEAITIWKGEPKAQYMVYTGDTDLGCGVQYTVGETVLVFASEWGDGHQRLGVTACSTLRPGTLSDPVALFGPGLSPPSSSPPSSSPASQTDLLVFYIVLAILVSIVPVAALLIKRRRKPTP
jgi:hypothetical protein